MTVALDPSKLRLERANDPVAQPLVIGEGLATEWRDVDAFAQQISEVIPLTHLGAIGQATKFRSRSATVYAGETVVLGGSHTSLHGSVEESDRATVLLTLAGEAHYWIERQCLEAKGYLTTLFLPGSGYRAQADEFNGAIFTVSPNHVLQVGAVMAGLDAPTAEMQDAMAKAKQMRVDVVRNSAPILGLRHALDLFNIPDQLSQDLAASLGIEDILHRCIALMLFPCFGENEVSTMSASITENRLKDIEDFLMANLEGRPSLTQIEQSFGLSRRTLQHAFRAKHGCGPMQWLRRQRLRYARNQLLAADQPKRSVAEVALECGYTNLSSFSRDFKELFAAKPSDYLHY